MLKKHGQEEVGGLAGSTSKRRRLPNYFEEFRNYCEESDFFTYVENISVVERQIENSISKGKLAPYFTGTNRQTVYIEKNSFLPVNVHRLFYFTNSTVSYKKINDFLCNSSIDDFSVIVGINAPKIPQLLDYFDVCLYKTAESSQNRGYTLLGNVEIIFAHEEQENLAKKLSEPDIPVPEKITSQTPDVTLPLVRLHKKQAFDSSDTKEVSLSGKSSTIYNYVYLMMANVHKHYQNHIFHPFHSFIDKVKLKLSSTTEPEIKGHVIDVMDRSGGKVRARKLFMTLSPIKRIYFVHLQQLYTWLQQVFMKPNLWFNIEQSQLCITVMLPLQTKK